MEDNIAHALRIIQDANLRHPDLALVESFLQNAAEPDKAAKYLLQICANDKEGRQFSQFVEDWKTLVKRFYTEKPQSQYLNNATRQAIVTRDQKRCCLTGTRSRFWNTSGVFPIIPLTGFYITEKRFHELLGVFLTPHHRDKLISSRDGNNISPQNHWFLCKDIAGSFSTGELQLENISKSVYDIHHNSGVNSPPSIKRVCRWESNLMDHSNTGIETPDQNFLEIHRRFAPALWWTNIATRMERRPNPRPQKESSSGGLSKIFYKSFLAIWKKFPNLVRLQAYKVLKCAGFYLYGAANSQVQRLPFGMHIKYDEQQSCSARIMNEFNALTLVNERTSIPTPRPLDLIITSNGSYLVTSRIDGVGAGYAKDECSDEEMHIIAQDLRKYIAELRAIQPPSNAEYAISNPSGGPILDYRIDVSPVGPFRTEKEFSDSLRLGGAPHVFHRDDHQIVFTHTGINLKNVILKDGRIAGIVNWENAGWYPEYWESSKCRFGVRFSKRWLKMLDEVFEGKYEEELGIEKVYWELDSGM